MVLVSPTQLKHQRAGAERRRRAAVSVTWAADAQCEPGSVGVAAIVADSRLPHGGQRGAGR